MIGKPSLGAWLSYGLGTRERESAELRRHDRSARRPDQQRVELDRGLHAGGLSGHAVSQPGRAAARPGHARRAPPTARSAHSLDLLKKLNRRAPRGAARRIGAGGAHRVLRAGLSHADRARPRWSTSHARARETQELYGLDDKLTADFGRKCLITRRLLEKGVRFVQLYSGGGHIEDTWDGHNDCIAQPQAARRRNRPADRGADGRPEAHRPVGRDAAHLGRRIRPHADQRRRRQAGPRPQPARLLACGWRAPA